MPEPFRRPESGRRRAAGGGGGGPSRRPAAPSGPRPPAPARAGLARGALAGGVHRAAGPPPRGRGEPVGAGAAAGLRRRPRRRPRPPPSRRRRGGASGRRRGGRRVAVACGRFARRRRGVAARSWRRPSFPPGSPPRRAARGRPRDQSHAPSAPSVPSRPLPRRAPPACTSGPRLVVPSAAAARPGRCPGIVLEVVGRRAHDLRRAGGARRDGPHVAGHRPRCRTTS